MSISSSVPLNAEASVAEHYRPYAAYKESGVELLEAVPEHWNVERLKYVSTLNDETLSESTDPNLTIAYIDISNVDANAGIIGTEMLSFEESPSRARRIIRHGDVIVSTVRTYLRAIAPIHDPPTNTIVSTGFAVVRPIRIHSKFASYALRSPYFVERVVANSVGVSFPAINAEDLASFPIVLPNLGEQRAIAAFLDRETAEIDALVAKKERLIELLQEQRTALIIHAVTKGLDPNVPMKDSGVEWLGKIPSHWSFLAIARVTLSRCDGPFGSGLKSEHYSSEGVRVIRLQNISGRSFLNSDQVFIDRSYANTLGDHSVFEGDLLIAGLGDDAHPVGRSCVAPEGLGRAMVKADCFRFRIDQKKAVPVFVAYQLSASAMVSAGYSVTGATRLRMNLTTTAARKVALPPVPEQHVIVEFLDRQMAKIDELVARVGEAIERLKELRAALISAAVTGKIDVRETAA